MTSMKLQYILPTLLLVFACTCMGNHHGYESKTTYVGDLMIRWVRIGEVLTLSLSGRGDLRKEITIPQCFPPTEGYARSVLLGDEQAKANILDRVTVEAEYNHQVTRLTECDANRDSRERARVHGGGYAAIAMACYKTTDTQVLHLQLLLLWDGSCRLIPEGAARYIPLEAEVATIRHPVFRTVLLGEQEA